MKKKLSKKLTLIKQTVNNLSEKEMTQSKGGGKTTMYGPQCDTFGGGCTIITVGC